MSGRRDVAVGAMVGGILVVLIIFVVWELYLGGRALLPLHLLKNRTQLGCCLLSFWIMLMFLSAIYYLPLFYQAKVRIALHRLLGLSLCGLAHIVTIVLGSFGDKVRR